MTVWNSVATMVETSAEMSEKLMVGCLAELTVLTKVESKVGQRVVWMVERMVVMMVSKTAGN